MTNIPGKTCPHCERYKRAEEFYPDPRSATGLRSRCIACTSLANHEAYERRKARKAD